MLAAQSEEFAGDGAALAAGRSYNFSCSVVAPKNGVHRSAQRALRGSLKQSCRSPGLCGGNSQILHYDLGYRAS